MVQNRIYNILSNNCFSFECLKKLRNVKNHPFVAANLGTEWLPSLTNGLHVSGPDEGAAAKGLKFTDPRVCKSFLRACCPHEILASTVSHLHLLYYLVLHVTSASCLSIYILDPL